MKKARNLSNRLLAMLLSMAMVFSPMLQSTPVYAAQAGAEAESTALLPEDSGSDEAVSDNAVSGNSVSDNAVTEDSVSGNSVSDNEAAEENAEETVEADISAETALSAGDKTLSAVTVSDFSNVGGWNESIYAEIAGVEDADVTAVSYSGTMEGELTGDDLTYLVRSNGNGGVRIDIPGLKAGTYTLNVTVGSNTLTKSGITVYGYDRSGYAHFNHSEGVGAYNNDGTLKENAVVLYVTDANKNTVTVSCGGVTVTGIGNILNSVGQDAGSGLTANGGAANTNQGIIKKLAEAGKPLVVRFVGIVSESGLYAKDTFNASAAGLIDGLTDYASLNNGGSLDDNGHMARIQSGKDITLEGIGYDATIDGWGFHYIAQTSNPELGKSFEVRNLTFINTPEDAIGMEGQQAGKNTSANLTASVERCWIHNNEFYCPSISSPAESDKSEGDGSVDFKRGMYFTCSYNYFEGCHKTNLVGSADYSLQFNLSYHHNHWYMCKARGPLARNANIHMYNNIVDMQTDYAQNTRADAYIFSEYNMFYACKSPQAVESGAIKSYHDSIASVIWNMGKPGTVVTDKAEYVPNACQFQAGGIKYDKFDVDSSLSYIPENQYKLDTDFTELRKVIVSQTGVLEQNPKLAEEVTTSEYSVLPENVTVHAVNSLPQKLTPGKISKTVYAFTVNAPVNLEVAYESAPGVLVNEAGENLLEGNGSLINLPAGTYMIQPVNFQPGSWVSGTTAVFKDITISTLNIEAYDSSVHYHSWTLDTSQSTAATCTDAGENVYVCSGCDELKRETVAPLGHAYSKAWTIDVPATETTDGEKSHHCTRCDARTDITVIPAGTTGDEGGSTAAGDYVLTFEGCQENDSADFFVVSGSYSNSKGSAIVNGVTYTDCLKMESKTSITFSCNDGATLFMAFASTNGGQKVKVDGQEYTTAADGTVTVELAEGSHTVTKKDSIFLFYLSVANGGSTENSYTLSFEYNYDYAPEAKTVKVVAGKTYASMAEMVPASFTRSNYVLSGLYLDASCSKAVTYPYVVKEDVTFYAEWKESDVPVEKTYSLIFNSNGGSAVATVKVSQSQVYEITEKSTRSGYAFAGWYDALEGGNPVSRVDGSKLTGNITVYAHWNVAEDVKQSLDCATDLTAGNITQKTTINGFTIHALDGGVGTPGSENPKYYMTVKEGKLYTNGVRIADTSITGNEDGMLKAIEFTVAEPSVLTVALALSGKPSSSGKYDLVLVKKTQDGSFEEVGRSAIVTGTEKTTKEFDIKEAGNYFVYAEGDKGVAYYSLKLAERIYTVLYQTGNGTAPEGLQHTAKAGEVIQIPDGIPALGYTFAGWTVDGGSTVLPNSSYTVNAEDAVDGVITVAAVYDPLTYTIRYDAGSGTLPAGKEETITASTGETLTLFACVPSAGQKFLGWGIGDSDEVFTSVYTVDAADADREGVITLKALYGPAEGLVVVLKEPGKDYIYTGSAIKPEIIVTNNGEVLTAGVDYTVKYSNNIKANDKVDKKKQAKITVTGKGNLTGSAFTTFEIKPKDISDADVEKGNIVIAKGAKPAPVLVYNNKKLTARDYTLSTRGADGTLTPAGKFSDSGELVVTGKGNFTGEITVHVTVKAKSELKKFTVTVGKEKLIYNPENDKNDEPQRPTVTVKDAKSKGELVKDTDYEIIWPEEDTGVGKNAGTVKFTVVGKGDYTGSVTKSYSIKPLVAAAGSMTVSDVSENEYVYGYSGRGATPGDDLVVSYQASEESEVVTLTKGVDYKVTYSNNMKVSTEKSKAKYTVTFLGNYKGTKALKGTFKVGAGSLSGAEVVAADKVYTGKPNTYVSKPYVTLDGMVLKTSDYTVKYYKDASMTEEVEINKKSKLTLEENDKEATVYVKVTGKGNYASEGSEAFGVYQVRRTSKEKDNEVYDLSKAKVTFYADQECTQKVTKLEYTGNALEPKVKVEYKIGKKYVPLEEGTHYEVTYVNNVKKGKATVVITGTGENAGTGENTETDKKYVGSKTASFRIVAKNLRKAEGLLENLFKAFGL